MPQARTTRQGGRSRSDEGSATLVERLTLPVTAYERQAMQQLALKRGLAHEVRTRTGTEIKGVGVGLLRTMSLQQIVAEYERMKAAGEIAA